MGGAFQGLQVLERGQCMRCRTSPFFNPPCISKEHYAYMPFCGDGNMQGRGQRGVGDSSLCGSQAALCMP